MLTGHLCVFGELTGSGLALSRPNECRGPTIRKTKKGGLGKSDPHNPQGLLSAVPLLSRGTQSQRDTEWRVQTKVGERNTALKSPKQVSRFLTLHKNRLLNLGRLSWTSPSGKLISYKNTRKVFEVKSHTEFSFRKQRICRIAPLQTVKERHADKNWISCHLFQIKLKRLFLNDKRHKK